MVTVDLNLLSSYDFELPENLIAQAPVSPRDSSRLLVVHRKEARFEHRRFSDLPDYFDAKDCVVANNTRVLKARLLGQRVSYKDGQKVLGGKTEFVMLESLNPRLWEGLFHASAKYIPGLQFEVPTPDGKGMLGTIVKGSGESPHGTIVVEFNRDPIEADAGLLPLPHYIDRGNNPQDLEDYQTAYAKDPGSAAAPTAGLHFTPELIKKMIGQGVDWEEVTLHVGLGTFRPVKDSDIRKHQMHEERYRIDEETALRINQAKASGHRITAVGTTSIRTLESASNPEGKVQAGVGKTSLFITPANLYRFRVVDRMITNFHLPRSTLLMLVSAFAGRDLILAAYAEAVREKYRFFSYGDAMLIL